MIEDKVVPIGAAAEMYGTSVEDMVSILADSGMLLVIPGTEDGRCRISEGIRWHIKDCGCRFVAAPHPDIRLQVRRKIGDHK